MKIEKVRRDVYSEINLDDFNRQQKITRIYVRKDEKYVLEEQLGVMDWSIDKKRELVAYSTEQWVPILRTIQLYPLQMMNRTTCSLFIQLYKIQFLEIGNFELSSNY